MIDSPLSPATTKFVDYFGELGPRWGLPADACRVHALVYVLGKPVSEPEITEALGLDTQKLKEALDYLSEFKVVYPCAPSVWSTSGDPWEMLLSGLEERKRQEMPLALSALESCHNEAKDQGDSSANQIEKMLDLVRGLGAIDAQLQRLPKSLVRGILNVSGRTAGAFGGSIRKRR